MSVFFANKVIAGLRSRGITVHLLNGWANRGNGQTSNYVGGIMHHTASAYGSAPRILWEGRSDLSGPLCNSAGNSDGSITIVAAHPANHAGASGGRSMGPLPVTRSFNKYVWGHEIVYPGDKPMTNAQYNSMITLGAVLTEALGRPNSEWIRGHAETSITGKWDPGYAPGRTIDMAQVRRNINARKGSGGDDFLSALTAAQQKDLYSDVQSLRAEVAQVRSYVRPGTTWTVKDGWLQAAFHTNNVIVPELRKEVDELSAKVDKLIDLVTKLATK